MNVDLEILEAIRIRGLIENQIKEYKEAKTLCLDNIYKEIDADRNKLELKILDTEIEELNKLLEKFPIN